MIASEINEAFKLRDRDLRARRLADSAVAAAMQEMEGRYVVDEGNFRQYAHDVARTATTILVSGIYCGDAEVAAMRAERDEYRRRYEELLKVTPVRFITNPPEAPPPVSGNPD